MSSRLSSVLVLDDADVPALDAAGPGVVVHRAHGPLQAAALLTRERPQWLVLNPRRAWHRAFVALLPPEARPQLVTPGEPTGDPPWQGASPAAPTPVEAA